MTIGNRALFVVLICSALFGGAVLFARPAMAQTLPGFEQCYLSGIERPVRCRDFKVPLDWSNPAGEKITIHMAVVPARGGSSEPDPFVVFAGGPGQAATDYGALVDLAFSRINEKRDIYLIDQRGTGSSTELDCLSEAPILGMVPPEIIIESTQECIETFAVDMRFFTSFDFIGDLEYIRKELGIERFNIWGGSYGTRLGLLYMREFPDSIRTAILDGVTAPNSRLFMLAPAGAEAAFQKMLSACKASEPCAAAFPDVAATFASVAESLSREPQAVALKNPWTGKTEEVLIDERWLAEIVRTALYSPSRTAVLPYAIEQAAAGNFDPFSAIYVESSGWAGDTMSIGMTLSVLCSEEVPRTSTEEAAEAGRGSFHKDYYYRFWSTACTGVPTRDVLEGYEEPVTAAIPTLLLSGGLDPITPPFSAEYAAGALPNSVHLVAPNSGHNVSLFGCAPKLMAQFVDRGNLEKIDGSCLDDPVRPPFLITPADFGLGPAAEEQQND